MMKPSFIFKNGLGSLLVVNSLHSFVNVLFPNSSRMEELVILHWPLFERRVYNQGSNLVKWECCQPPLMIREWSLSLPVIPLANQLGLEVYSRRWLSFEKGFLEFMLSPGKAG